jgi:hypothetical protein
MKTLTFILILYMNVPLFCNKKKKYYKINDIVKQKCLFMYMYVFVYWCIDVHDKDMAF